MIITIDGPSGTGKSTVARQVAERLRFVYFDTGAMYRALTWFVMERNVDITDSAAMLHALKEFDYQITDSGTEKRYFASGHDVTTEIRSRAVTQKVSAVSALGAVRSSLMELQYRFAKAQDAVFEGRDLGTVVFPNAEVKVFLDASPSVRAERRMKEIFAKMPAQFQGMTREEMLADLMRRDEHDSTREIAPLRCPPGALKIDTTELTANQVVDQIVAYCLERLPNLKKL